MIKMYLTTFGLLLAGIAHTVICSNRQDIVTVETPSGKIEGVITATPVTFEPVYQFRKIPYAKPPVGDLRFRKPEPYGNWEGNLDATEFGPSCMQPNIPIADYYELPNYNNSEDCLFLNIYVPNKLSKDSKLPVMIWVHGGGYVMGQGMFYPASTLSTFGDVIVVTINYRLGIFGFFSLNNEHARGNYGIWDQIMAFQWVHKNIAAFGGDPNSITIFGESAGGFSVSLQAMIPINKGVVRRVIEQSGSSSRDFAFSKGAHIFSRETGERLGCQMSSDADSATFMECIRGKSAEEINEEGGLSKLYDPTKFNMTSLLAPVVDGELFRDKVSNLLSYPDVREVYYSLDIIVGTTDHEGSLLYMTLGSPQLQEDNNFNITNGIPKAVGCSLILNACLHSVGGGYTEEAAHALCDHYYPDPSASLEEQSMAAVDMYGDAVFVAPSIHSVNSHSRENTKTSTYFYRLSKASPMPLVPPPPWYKGSGHGDDIGYVFGDAIIAIVKQKVELTQEDKTVSESMMRYWTNFAKSGNPNKPVTQKGLVEWPEYDTTNQRYMDLNVQCTAQSKPSPGAAKLWTETLPKLLGKGKKLREEL